MSHHHISHHQDLGEKNIFEEISELLERHRLSSEKYFPLGDFYDIISNFDIAYQQFNNEVNEYTAEVYYKYLNRTLGNFLTIFKAKGFRDEPIFYAFKRFIAFFTFLINEAGRVKNIKDIQRNFSENFPGFEIDIRELEEDAKEFYAGTTFNGETAHNQDIIYNFETNIAAELGILSTSSYIPVKHIVYANDAKAKYIIWDEEEKGFTVDEEFFYLIMDIKIGTEVRSAEKMLTPLWLITSALEKIENVIVEIDEIYKGSLNTRIKIWMKDVLANEEVKAVLDTAKELAVQKLSGGDISYAEVKKSRQEIKQIKLENDKLIKELDAMPASTDVKLERALEMEKKMLDNEKQKVEITQEKIKAIQMLSELVEKGILSADMIKIDINDVLYFLKSGNQVREIGPDISEIS